MPDDVSRMWTDRVLIIAEIGCNHDGDMARARQLIDAAAAAGADVAKFQSFIPEEMASINLAKAAYQAAATDPGVTQYERLCSVSLDDQAHHLLAEYCRTRSIVFGSSPFDVPSARRLRNLGVPFFKIPSGEITNDPLLREIGSYGRPILLSTGMADLAEIEHALKAIGPGASSLVALLHCVSAYPTAWADANLRAIETLRRTFALPVGFSDHSTGIELPLAAVALGARVIEKHITLDRGLRGGDHKASLEPDEFNAMVRAIRALEPALGDGVKRCLPVEEDVRRVARKSIVARTTIEAGQIITDANLALKRPGTGLPPSALADVVGREALVTVNAGELLGWSHVNRLHRDPPSEPVSAPRDDVRVANVTAPPSLSIRELMKRIDVSGLRGAFVCDDDQELLGVVMDSDVRRAILRNSDLHASIKTIMRTSTFAVDEATTEAERARLLLGSGKLLVPIVDRKRRIVDYLSINEVLSNRASGNDLDGGVFPPARVLVIGGAGYIGSMLVDAMLKSGYRVRVLDILLYDKRVVPHLKSLAAPATFEFIRGDCRDPETVLRAMEGVAAVVHLGEIVGDPACQIDEGFTIDTNHAATQTIVESCMKLSIPRFVFASSCSVYGQSDEEVSEDSLTNPVSLYARCKIESERAIQSCGTNHLCSTILRLSTAHGLSHRPRLDLVVNHMTIKAVFEGRIQIMGGQQWRPFVSVRDICRGILRVINAPRSAVNGQIFNLGDSRENYQIAGIGRAIQDAVPEVTVEVLAAETDNRNYRVSFDKIRSQLGFSAMHTVRDSIDELLAAYRTNEMFSDPSEPRYSNLLALK